MSIALLSAVSFFSSSVLAAEPIGERNPNQVEGVRVELHASVGNYGAFGVGVRGDIPIVPNGLLNGVHDELVISPGLEVFFVEVYPHEYAGNGYVMPLAMLQWNFYLGDNWSVFPEAGVAVYVGDRDFMPRGRGVYAGFGTGIGARYHMSPRTALVLRAGWPAGLQAGVAF